LVKILHLYKDYYPVLGGIENHIKVLAEAQAAAGHQVIVLACDVGWRTRIEELNGVRVIKAGRLTTAASMPLSLTQPVILARLGPDIVHIHSPYPLGEVASHFLGQARATIITHHSDVVRQRGWLRLYGPLLRRVLRATDRIIATSPRYIETSPWLRPVRDRCVVVPLGVEVDRFAGERARQTGRELLFVGKLRYYKGVDDLLRALVEIMEVRLTVVGDGPMRGEWEALARQLDLADRVIFTGEVPDDELPTRYAAADLFVLPANARAEAFGTVLLEAMAAGLPCITTEVGTGTSWVVQHGVTGLVVPPRNPEALAGAIRQLLTDPDVRWRMGQRGRQRARQEFSQQRMVQGVMDLYQAILA
jgi:rhamnosyl/mannosyltransferase